MKAEQTKEYYDQLDHYGPNRPFFEELAKYAVYLLGSAWTGLADIGCGPGFVAAALGLRNSGYRGFDISPTWIDTAKIANPHHCFEVANVNDWQVRRKFSAIEVDGEYQYDAFIICEVLEHVHDDLGLLEAIPAGAKVVFSVPNFDDPGHVRWFDSFNDAFLRYKGLIDIKMGRQFSSPATTEKRFLFMGVRHG